MSSEELDGLQLNFEHEEIKKHPSLTSHKVGDKVHIIAHGSITSVRQSERQGEPPSHSVGIQIEKIKVSPAAKDPKKMSPKEYREFREKKD